MGSDGSGQRWDLMAADGSKRQVKPDNEEKEVKVHRY